MALSRPDAVVVGAGPYGLAAASYLGAGGLDCRVFGTTMAGWSRHMPKGMFLKSTAIDSSIGAPQPGFGIGDFCAARGITPYDDGGGERPIPVEEFVAYGRWFQEQRVPQVEDVRVVLVERAPGGFAVELDTGERLVTANVVVAVGPAPFAYSPPEIAEIHRTGGELRGLPRVSHARDHADLGVFAGRRVAVIGAGQSALESAVLLREAGAEVGVLVRKPPLRWAGPPEPGSPGAWERLRRPAAPLGRGWLHLVLTRYAGMYRHLPESVRLRLVGSILGPAGAWWLHERFTADIDVYLGYRVAAATVSDEGLDLILFGESRGSCILRADHLIAATGYRVDLGRVAFLDSAITDALATTGPFPRLSPTFESSVPGLFFSGITAAGSFGPMLRFVAGTDFAARRVCAGVRSRVLHPSAGASDADFPEESAA